VDMVPTAFSIFQTFAVVTLSPTFTNYLQALGGKPLCFSCVQKDMHDRSQVDSADAFIVQVLQLLKSHNNTKATRGDILIDA
jgi:hypothetical protein